MTVSQEQAQVYEAVMGYVREHGHPPTVRTICDVISKTSSTVHAHLIGLERKGYLTRQNRAGIYWPTDKELVR